MRFWIRVSITVFVVLGHLMGFRMVPEVTKKLDKFSGSLVIFQKAKTDILLDLHFTDEREAEIVLRNC